MSARPYTLNTMDVRIEESWKARLSLVFAEPWFARLTDFVRAEYGQAEIYPPARYIFRAFDLCPFDTLRVVIVGQDPYHGVGQANGLAFSVGKDIEMPPSLINIFNELESDLGRPAHADRTLTHWAEQGVLLINSVLTVRAGAAGSHTGRGWEDFTDAVLRLIAAEKEHTVFILWGAQAQKKAAFVQQERHAIIKSPHPSPLSAYRGFLGSKPFSRTNEILRTWGLEEIDW